jgi:hypothetical protein
MASTIIKKESEKSVYSKNTAGQKGYNHDYM